MKLPIIAAAALIAFTLCTVPARAQDKPKIYVGPSSKTLGYSPLWVGSKKGFFEQQGLDVQVVVLRGIPMVVLGPGEPQLAHQTDEYCLLDRIGQADDVYGELMKDWSA